MPIILHDARFDTVLKLLRTQSGGVTLGQVEVSFSPRLPQRTVQRLLASLVAAGVLTVTGARRYRQYHLRTKPGALGAFSWVDPQSQIGQMAAECAPELSGRKATGRTRTPRRVQPLSRPTPDTDTPASHRIAAPTTSIPAAKIAEPLPRADVTITTQQAPTSSPALNSASLPSMQPAQSARAPLPSTPSIPPARIQPLLDQVVPNFVRNRITPDRVRYEVGLPAVTTFALQSGETPDDLATLVTAELDRIAPADLLHYGLTRAEFDAWREIQWPAGSALAGASSPTPLPPLPLPPSISAPRVGPLLEMIAEVVRRNLRPDQLPKFVEQTSRMILRGAETPADWQTLLLAELNRFRVEDCPTYKIRPEAYRLWRKTTWPIP